jgi:hypothetical protein
MISFQTKYTLIDEQDIPLVESYSFEVSIAVCCPGRIRNEFPPLFWENKKIPTDIYFIFYFFLNIYLFIHM